jgi:DNA ligase-1
MTKTFKPMLAPNEVPTDEFIATRLPLLASYKLDGIRCTVQGGTLLSRSLKPLPNKFLQELFAKLPEGIDGELVQGVTQDNETFKRSHKIVMKSDRPLNFFGDTVRLHVFDRFGEDGFHHRLLAAHLAVEGVPCVVPVKHRVIETMADLAAFEKKALALGYEGVMLRSMDGPYKQGRATLNQGWLMKLKRYVDAEARVLSCYEERENQNEEFTNELGRTARSSHQDGLVGKNQLGGFNVVGVNGVYKGVEFRVSSSSIDHETRKYYWTGRNMLTDQILTYKYFPIGSDERPRAPVFKGFRSEEDMTNE